MLPCPFHGADWVNQLFHLAAIQKGGRKMFTKILCSCLLLSVAACHKENSVAPVNEPNQTTDNIWVAKANMPTARIFLSACAVGGKIYAFAGTAGSPFVGLSTLECYDPVSDSWTGEPDLPYAVCGPATCQLNGDIYIIGGAEDMQGVTVSSVYVYHVATKTYSRLADMPTPRAYACANAVGGKIYVIGGSGTGYIPVYSTVEVYDPATDSWTKKADMPTARTCLSSTVVEGKIYVLGGTDEAPWPGLTEVEVYDPATDTWTAKAEMPTGRWSFCTSAWNGKIYAIGGDSEKSGAPTEFSTVEEYDPTSDSWTSMTQMPAKRAAIAGDIVNGKIYVIGGGYHTATGTLVVLSKVEEYDPAADTSSAGK
jgi:N-acetylneuraminic acid mutarotase